MNHGPAPWQQRNWDWRAAGNFIFGGAGAGVLAAAGAAAAAASNERPASRAALSECNARRRLPTACRGEAAGGGGRPCAPPLRMSGERATGLRIFGGSGSGNLHMDRSVAVPAMHLDFDVISRSLPYLWQGFQYTMELTVVSAVGALGIDAPGAVARADAPPASAGAAASGADRGVAVAVVGQPALRGGRRCSCRRSPEW